jgi:type IV pilus assembly protein PilB
VLHSDPEAVLVDEIEESESLALATGAAIAGRLVLAALHAPSAVAVPLRLVDMGVEPYLVAASLSCVVSQRLVRTLCLLARTARSRPLLQKLGVHEGALERRRCADRSAATNVAIGLPRADRRVRVMPITESMQRLVQDRAGARAQALAVAEGMETMQGRAQPRSQVRRHWRSCSASRDRRRASFRPCRRRAGCSPSAPNRRGRPR